MPYLLFEKFEAILYADDTSLSSILKTFYNRDTFLTSANINKELGLIYDWLQANKLSLNIKKTKYMVFRYHQKPRDQLPKLDIYIKGYNLEQVNNFEFLGLTINETLSWRDHIEKTANKISKVIGILARSKRYLHSSILLKIYNALILSRVNYAITCWGFENKRIYKLQKKALRIICKSKYNAHTDPLFIRLKTLKVREIFHCQCLKFYYNHERGNLPSYFQNIIKRNISGHDHDTRQRNDFQSTNTNKVSSNKTLRHLLPKLLKSVPANLVNSIQTLSLQTVKRNFKRHFLSTYQPECSIHNCYICNK